MKVDHIVGNSYKMPEPADPLGFNPSELGNLNTEGQVVQNEWCTPGFMSSVILPLVERTENYIPSNDNFFGRTINRLTSINDFLGSFKSDLCRGQLSYDSAKYGAKLIAKSSAAIFAGQAGLTLAGIGGVAAGVSGLGSGVAAGLGIGVGALVAGTYIVDKAVDLGFSAFENVMQQVKNYRINK